MKKAIKVLEIISDNLAEGWLLAVFVFSVCPFIIPDWRGHLFYTSIGGICSFTSVLFVHLLTEEAVKAKKKMRVYSILAVPLLLLGASAYYFLHGKMANDINYSPTELFFTTHFGAMLGMIMGGIVCEGLFKKRQITDY